jgi:hypothetical protein
VLLHVMRTRCLDQRSPLRSVYHALRPVAPGDGVPSAANHEHRDRQLCDPAQRRVPQHGLQFAEELRDAAQIVGGHDRVHAQAFVQRVVQQRGCLLREGRATVVDDGSDEHDRLHELGAEVRQLDCDLRSHRLSDDSAPADAEALQGGGDDGGVPADAQSSMRRCRAAEAGQVDGEGAQRAAHEALDAREGTVGHPYPVHEDDGRRLLLRRCRRGERQSHTEAMAVHVNRPRRHSHSR